MLCCYWSVEVIDMETGAPQDECHERQMKIALIQPEKLQRIEMLLVIEQISRKLDEHGIAAGKIDFFEQGLDINAVAAHIL
ncbi:MAG TPA: hypothetical protein VHD63_12855, partial [Ktedonobacteraceae bacterium]|nr:hypothetical protein [Ktedonobacteraceae bacterium]